MTQLSTRLGTFADDDGDRLTFPAGVLGLPQEREFLFVAGPTDNGVGWLQSTTTPGLALPVVSAHVLDSFGQELIAEAYQETEAAGIDTDDLAIMVVLNARGPGPASVNTRAPVVIDTRQSRGAQIILSSPDANTRELFVFANGGTENASGSTAAEEQDIQPSERV